MKCAKCNGTGREFIPQGEGEYIEDLCEECYGASPARPLTVWAVDYGTVVKTTATAARRPWMPRSDAHEMLVEMPHQMRRVWRRAYTCETDARLWAVEFHENRVAEERRALERSERLLCEARRALEEARGVVRD